MNKKFNYPPKVRQDFLYDVVRPMVRRRIKLKLRQEDVNNALNVADRLVSKWECGERTPTSFNLYCWADVLNGRIVFLPNEHFPLLGSDPLLTPPANDNANSQDVTKNDIFSITKKIIGDTT